MAVAAALDPAARDRRRLVGIRAGRRLRGVPAPAATHGARGRRGPRASRPVVAGRRRDRRAGRGRLRDRWGRGDRPRHDHRPAAGRRTAGRAAAPGHSYDPDARLGTAPVVVARCRRAAQDHPGRDRCVLPRVRESRRRHPRRRSEARRGRARLRPRTRGDRAARGPAGEPPQPVHPASPWAHPVVALRGRRGVLRRVRRSRLQADRQPAVVAGRSHVRRARLPRGARQGERHGVAGDRGTGPAVARRARDGAAGVSTPLRLAAIRKRYDAVEVLAGIDIEVAASEIVAIVGPSGCGKSTLLRLVAGLDTEYEGEIRIGERAVRGPDRAVGVVFQEPRLFPWLRLDRNVAFGLEDHASPRAAALVRDTLQVVGLTAFSNALPKELSGGMAQRAALARALVTEPQVLLLDEPFSSLDAFTRMRLQEHLLAAWARYRPTLVLVTHDLDEAVYLADRVILLTDRPARVADVLRVAPGRPRDRRDPSLLGLRVALLEALHLERSQLVGV